RYRLGDGGSGASVVGQLIDGEHQRVLEDDIGAAVVLALQSRQRNVNAITWQDKAPYPFNVVYPYGDGLHAVMKNGGKRGALAWSGDLDRQNRLVDLDCRKHHSLAARQHVTGGCERAFGQRFLGPWNLVQYRRGELVAEPQRLAGHDDG